MNFKTAQQIIYGAVMAMPDDDLDWRQAVSEREMMTSEILEKVKPYLTENEYKHLCFETGINWRNHERKRNLPKQQIA